MTWQDLKVAVGALDSNDTQLQSTYETAAVLVNTFVGYNPDPLVLPVVPDSIREFCILKVATELWNSRRRQGFADFNDADGQPVRVSRDPMTVAYPILRQFMVIR